MRRYQFSVPNRFFDWVSASYYLTDNSKLSIGHLYIFGRSALRLGGEQGFALGGGRMAALFAEGTLGEHGAYSALAGLRIYFGQRDKNLMERHRQDDPAPTLTQIISIESQAMALLFVGAAILEFDRAAVVHPLITR
jgi:hypothetical protein